MKTLRIILATLDDTKEFGKKLAESLSAYITATNKTSILPGLFFSGDLGAGKTTLTRAIVEALPGGKEAEISSPSFTICNQYNTQPRVCHYDLYRLPDSSCPEELEESLEAIDTLNIVEWSEKLGANLPEDVVRCHISEYTPDGNSPEQPGRELFITGTGKNAEKLLEILEQKIRP